MSDSTMKSLLPHEPQTQA